MSDLLATKMAVTGPTEDPLAIIDRLVRGNSAIVPSGAWKRASIRFENGEPCCTTTYNATWPAPQQAAMARRIVAALNLTRHLRTELMEEMVANRQTRILEQNGGDGSC